MKFGGSSLASAEKFNHVVALIEQQQQPVAAVFSAPQGITNDLVTLIELINQQQNLTSQLDLISQKLLTISADCVALRADFDSSKSQQQTAGLLDQLRHLAQGCELIGFCPEITAAQILSSGEKFSTLLMATLLRTKSPVTVLDPRLFIHTDSDVNDTVADLPRCQQEFNKHYQAITDISVMPGFYGVNHSGDLVTLGRNGSDYSAAILAVCVDAESCEIWTDVDGIYSVDPHLVPETQLIEQMSYQEAMELSYFGAKILHPKTITPLANQQIKCVIKNTHNPDHHGTTITTETAKHKAVKAISNLSDVVMINVSGPGMKGMVGMAARVFATMSEAQISVILISQSSSEYSISFCVPGDEATKAVRRLEKTFKLELKNGLLEPIQRRNNLAIITLIGDQMHQQKGTASRFFSALSHARVNIIAIAQDSSERSISAVVRAKRVDDAVVICHQQLFLKKPRIDAFLIGCGTVGRELIAQIKKQQEWLQQKNIELNLIGIANSRQCLLEADGVDLEHWQEQLTDSETSFSLSKLADFVRTAHITNPVIIDCTSNQGIAMDYLSYLEHNFHVVTANKKANTDTLSYYHQLHQMAAKRQRRFLYETNVGAGLPVIDNLQSLLRAGDELIQFEGILSGSLSYIFGEIHQGLSLSEATKKARDLGYTEPNPAEDLNGMDVARKVLVIAREAGMALELNDVDLQAVVPPALAEITDGDAFMQQLPAYDQEFQQKIDQAENQQQKLRYVAIIKNGKCAVKIQAVDKTHPLYDIEAGENALAINTQYYQPKPFIIRGYGAGAEVTAAGLFGDMLRTLAWEQEY
ncbi:bifunctional aspartate kinase/homoserine dehydrogenase I [Marinicella sp. S1101]|uniref:bifunctional aspartate kinase/homoserine dehydrogenase I n=1 Tax=Marinicella marina TaxID=2996016 RepID=UPI002260D802|nr:bifunctional aspartate kinase/homoserine dehydrogenase I [Marinicella marina]MCX7552384.1 bifunctional aspartate kinase/homoserine dehydrogenase I [Marinicella marina]MDJ1139259.1 bifunctional aspartate kinase/homoserine dehydrogenase I [Marinicella marina]